MNPLIVRFVLSDGLLYISQIRLKDNVVVRFLGKSKNICPVIIGMADVIRAREKIVDQIHSLGFGFGRQELSRFY